MALKVVGNPEKKSFLPSAKKAKHCLEDRKLRRVLSALAAFTWARRGSLGSPVIFLDHKTPGERRLKVLCVFWAWAKRGYDRWGPPKAGEAVEAH